MNESVEIIGLSKSYDGKTLAVNNINITLPKGKIIGLLGPNGSGKTTLIKLLNGLLKPDQGEIKVGGVPVGPQTKAKVAFLPDRNCLAEYRTVEELVDFFGDFYADFSREKALEMIASLSIDLTATFNTLSTGTREKV